MAISPGVAGRMAERKISGVGELGESRRGRFTSRPPWPGFGVEVREPVEEPDEESGPERFPGRYGAPGRDGGILLVELAGGVADDSRSGV